MIKTFLVALVAAVSLNTAHARDPMIKERYMNCGDWTSKCTALIEHYDGTWELQAYSPKPS